jgi:hypothetical protein
LSHIQDRSESSPSPQSSLGRVELQVVEEFEGQTDAAFVPIHNSELRLSVSTRDHVRICWKSTPETVLIIKRFRDPVRHCILIRLFITWISLTKVILFCDLTGGDRSADRAGQLAAQSEDSRVSRAVGG